MSGAARLKALAGSAIVLVGFGSGPARPAEWRTTAEILYGNSYTFENDVSSLEIRGQGVLRLTRNTATGTDFGFRDPRFSIAYMRQGENAQLNLSAYQNWDTLIYADAATLPAGVSPNDDGTLVTTGAQMVYAIGTTDPVGATLSLHYNRSDYLNTTNKALNDSHGWGGTLATRATLGPTTQATLTLGYDFLATDNKLMTERTTRTVSLGVTQELTPIWTVDGSVGYSYISTDYTAVPKTTNTTGFTGALGATREMVNGQLSARLSRNQDANGALNTFRFSREIETTRGSISGNVGTTWRDGGSFALIGGLSYMQQFETGTLSLNVARNVAIDENDKDVTTTSVGADFSYDVTELDSVDLSFDWSHSNGAKVAAADYKTIGLSYTRSLTEDWNLVTGAQTRLSNDKNGKATNNWLFVRLARDF